MGENHISNIIIGKCIDIHRELGPGLLESVYEEILTFELSEAGLDVQRQKGISVHYKGRRMDLGFRADLIVENRVLVELKSIETILNVHHKIVLTYLKLSGLKLGLLINFNEELLKNGISRIVNNL